MREVCLYKSGPANHKKEVVLKYQCSSEFPGGLVKTLMLDHILEFPVQRSGIRLESCLLRYFQMLLLLLVLGPHFEDHWIRASLICKLHEAAEAEHDHQ